MTHGYLSCIPSNSRALQVLAPVVQTLDSAIHPIKIYPVDDAIVFPNTYPLDSDLSGDSAIQRLNNRDLNQRVNLIPGADPGFFLGGGTLVSCSTSTPINHIVFFFCRIPIVLEN